MIITAGNTETLPFAQPVGIGMVESSVELTKLILLHPPEFLLFLGSAGSYGPHKIFDLFHSQTASQIEQSYLSRQSYTPMENNVISSDLSVSRETNPLAKMDDKVVVNSGNYITTDFKNAEKFTKLGITAENMEFFSVMHVAQSFGIPCGGIFVVTNYCDKDAHESYRCNIAKAWRMMESYVRERIQIL